MEILFGKKKTLEDLKKENKLLRQLKIMIYFLEIL
jgi:hypothetical protein